MRGHTAGGRPPPPWSVPPVRRRRPCAALGPWPLPSRRARAEHGTVRTWWSAPAAVALLVLAACAGRARRAPRKPRRPAPPHPEQPHRPRLPPPRPPLARPRAPTRSPTRPPTAAPAHRTTTARDDHRRPHAPDHGAPAALRPRPDCASDVAPGRRAHLRRRCRQPRRPLDPRHAAGRGVPASFFVTGRFAQANPGTTSQMAALGPVGNHSLSHPDFTTLTDTALTSELLDRPGGDRAPRRARTPGRSSGSRSAPTTPVRSGS